MDSLIKKIKFVVQNDGSPPCNFKIALDKFEVVCNNINEPIGIIDMYINNLKGGDHMSATAKSLHLPKEAKREKIRDIENGRIEKSLAFIEAEKRIRRTRESVLAKLFSELGRWWI